MSPSTHAWISAMLVV